MIQAMKSEWKELLLRRNDRNRVLIQIENRPSRWKTAISELRKGGYIVWLDYFIVPLVSEKGPYPVSCDVYLLTPSGVKLCDDNGIKKRQ